MEHEVFVPVPAEALRATLTDPGRVARCLPGFERDASEAARGEGSGAGTGAGADLVGRFRLRVGGHTITYRGGLRIVERDGAITYEGEGTEVRGKGVAEISLTVVLTPAAEGTGLGFTGALSATGRLADEPEEARDAARARLLDAFVEAAAALAAADAPAVAPDDAPGESPHDAPEGETAFGTGAFDGGPGPGGDPGFDDDVLPEPAPPVEIPAAPAAEAAHARRTMIGRSAEEVDHAPPRGRYAPVPAPEPSGAGATLRWVAPAAALALASAVLVGRALRRRR
ncbi:MULTISPECIES: SRPBCC family protein [Streptomyces]|uniref:SRPBCC family protein n=2 Tax=Streptomyces TaxID=1883 RepID=A0ABU4K5K9_9ACTN|nr:SRPBCC family protein [Streptomyces roseolus]MDX2293041.1 SRPBCC family protein [Streptomyces roseolus]